ncbi:uncharacterized protein LOC130052314 [Ostrea edulis]|uniref:uncharacterized protein LOC130052314 n=1 Tax=Ostrea edulis TaxID=37623 RepID=UPI0024AEF583|nr:uncharacterized protein LOC130052314 [Ostrea edulis]
MSKVPVTPQHVEENMPPPSYEEVMGHQALSSVKANLPKEQLPPLAYIDIMPRCLHPGDMRRKAPPEYDRFSTLIGAANFWLRANQSYGVWKCETVERKVENNGSIVMDKMIFHESTYGFNVLIRGLRLWLFVKDPTTEPQQLGLLNKVPKKLEANPTHQLYHPYAGFVVAPLFLQTFGALLNTYEGFQETLQRLNEDLQKQPLQGSVLNVESATLKVSEGNEKAVIDPDNTVCHENGGKMKRYTQIIRVFYVIGEPAKETIGVKEFIPSVKRPPDITVHAQFQNFEEVMTKFTKWLPHQTAIRMVNIQSFDVRYKEEMGGLEILSELTDDIDDGMTDRLFLNTLRVFYVTAPKVPPPQPISFITSRLFLPVRTGERSFESMSQTMFRIEAWLKVTGIPVYSVETVRFLYREPLKLGVDDTRTNYTSFKGVGKYYVTAVRVYFLYPFQEPHPNYLPPASPWDPSMKPSSTCSIQ